MNNNHFKTVDVVIMTYKPGHKFILLIKSLLNQNYKINKIYIINTEKEYFYFNFNDNEKKEIELILDNRIFNVIDIKEYEFDHGKSRNIILKYSKADYIVFFTNDAIPYDDSLISNLVEGMNKNDKIKVSYARQIPYKDAFYKEKLIREFNYPSYDIIKSKDTINKYGIKNYFSSNVCAIYDFGYFKSKNGFIENVILNEDTYFAYNVIKDGYLVFYNSNAKVYHSHNYGYIKQFKRYFDIGVSHMRDELIFKNIKTNNEGFRLIKFVLSDMIKKYKIISIIDFIIDTIFRYLGFILGKNFKILNINICKKLSMNKNYFLKDQINDC